MKHLQLPPEHVKALKKFTRNGSKNVREVNRAYMLLWLDKGKKMAEIVLDVERTAIWLTKTNYLKKGLDCALKDNPRSVQPTKYKQTQQAGIIVLPAVIPRKAASGGRWNYLQATQKRRQAYRPSIGKVSD